MYSLMTIRELRAELRRRNAAISGKKADLIERLEAYDRNQNFGYNMDVDEDCSYVCPPADTYRDINADSPLPNISKQEIQEYFQRFNTHPKGQLLYESRHLLTARYSSDGTYTFIKGQCKASMKKVAYEVNVKVGAEGTIEECHCECAAGSGTTASCKHVSVLLLGIHDITNNNIIKLHPTCTQQLMMFKKPKKVFYNSPIAAKNLPSKRVSCNYKPLKESDIIENYNDYVRNLAIGYGGSTMPLLQTYEPANPHGIEWDHCYTKQNNIDKILEKLLLKNVTLTQIRDVEERTRLQDASIEWHELRKCRITASMFYVVCHSTERGKNTLVHKIISPKQVNTRAVVHGKIQEPADLKKYEETYDLTVQWCGLVIAKDLPFLAASPDGLLGQETVIEIKCPFSSRNSVINEVTVPYLYSDENGHLQLKKTHPYYAQIQGQLYCTDRVYCNFIVYTFVGIKVIFVPRDDQCINELVTNLFNFYIYYLEPAICNKYYYKNYLSIINKKPI